MRQAPERLAAVTILAATAWHTNGDMIADVVALGYIEDDDIVLDSTYGRGKWWTKWRPAEDLFITNNFEDGGWDFRKAPYDDDVMDVITYDPPYVSMGGRKTTGLPDMANRYGMDTAPATPLALQQLINDGMGEMHRILRPGGIMFVKCQSYISSGKMWLGEYSTLKCALGLGMEVVDHLVHLSGVRPQPPGRRQVHSRRNYSSLYILKK